MKIFKRERQGLLCSLSDWQPGEAEKLKIEAGAFSWGWRERQVLLGAGEEPSPGEALLPLDEGSMAESAVGWKFNQAFKARALKHHSPWDFLYIWPILTFLFFVVFFFCV